MTADTAPAASGSHRPLAVVTGASGGIGEAFARRLAPAYDLLLVARSTDKLAQLRGEFSSPVPGAHVETLSADLATDDGVDALIGRLRDRDVRLLVNNAGVGMHGDVADADPDALAAMVQLNCTALTRLTRAVLPGMRERGRGGIVNVASTAAFQPLPTMTAYAASKAYVLAFTEGVAEEVRTEGVTVVALCPGPTETAFFANAGTGGEGREVLSSGRQTSEQVVDTAMRALNRRQVVAISGAFNAAQAFAVRFAPRAAVRRLGARVVSPH